MKKTVSLILITVLILTTIAPVRAESIYFVAVNDTIPGQLSAATMPFYYGGVLYVPHTTFDAEELGVYYSNNARENILTLYNRVGSTTKRLTFDLSSGTVSDENDNESNYAARSVGGLIFIPIAFVCEHFSLGCSFLTASQDYPMVRITNGKEQYEDEGFIIKSKNLVDDKAAKYLTGQNQEQTAPPTTTQTQDPQPPVVTDPEPEPSDEPPDIPVQQVPRSLTLCIAGICQSAVVLLDTYSDVSAAVFLTKDDMNSGDLIRRLFCEGYSLGAAVDMSDEDAALKEYDDINYSLSVIIKTKTLLVCPTDPENVSEQAVEALRERGCVVWQYGIDVSTDYLTVANYEDGINIFINGDFTHDESAGKEFSAFLGLVSGSQDTVGGISEAAAPPSEAYVIMNEMTGEENGI